MKKITSKQGMFFFKDISCDYRHFTTTIIIGDNEKEWQECTQSEREEWEKEHNPQPEPVEDPEEKTE